MKEELMREAVGRWGTPLYIFDLDDLKKTMHAFHCAMGSTVQICYAIKANPFIIEEMSQLADRIEVCSMGEYRICRAKAIPPEKILISGVLKKAEDLQEILDTWGGICQYTVESLSQLQQLTDWAQQHEETLRVFPRLTNGSQFGIDQNEMEEILSRIESLEKSHIHIQGIHYFTGTQKKKLSKIKKELDMLDQLLAEWKERFSFNPKELEYGPGLWVDYFSSGDVSAQEEREQLGEIVRSMCSPVQVTLEMGRELAADCGLYLTQIADIKQNKGRNYCITDGGIHQLSYDGQIRGMYVPNMQILRKENGIDSSNREKCDTICDITQSEMPIWTVCGSLCTTNDVLVQQFPAKELSVGDVLVFEQTGAYSMTEGMALFLSHELPGVVSWKEESGWKMLREQTQTWPMNV